MCVCARACALSLEALGADHGCDQRGEVQGQADPAGRHLDPEHGPAPLQQLLDLMVVVATVRRHNRPGKTKP